MKKLYLFVALRRIRQNGYIVSLPDENNRRVLQHPGRKEKYEDMSEIDLRYFARHLPRRPK